jgi:hypothetical protein
MLVAGTQFVNRKNGQPTPLKFQCDRVVTLSKPSSFQRELLPAYINEAEA